MLCEYGCGQEALFQFKNGKWCCSKNWESCSASRKKRSESGKRVWEDPEKRKNIEDAKNRLEVKEKQSKSMEEIWRDPEIRKNRTERMIESQNRPEVKKNNSDSKRECWKDPLKRKSIIDAINRLEVKEKQRLRWLGDKNPLWNPNREEVFTPYSEKFFDNEYRNQIKQEQCYLDAVTNELLLDDAHLHHIDYDKQNDKRENLIWLNCSTHIKTNFNREKWKFVLQEINRNIIKEIKMEGKNSV